MIVVVFDYLYRNRFCGKNIKKCPPNSYYILNVYKLNITKALLLKGTFNYK